MLSKLIIIYFLCVKVGANARTRYVWLQDVFGNAEGTFTPLLMSIVQGVFVLSEYHGSFLPQYTKYMLITMSTCH